jgi:S1-C subfamily serine protease
MVGVFDNEAPASPKPAPEPERRTRLQRVRYRILPRSVLGIASLILAFAIGAGFSGVVLYSYYQYKQNQADNRVNALISGYKAQFNQAEADLNAAVAAAKANINEQVQAAQQAEGTPAQVAGLIKQLASSMFYVHTLDASGQPSVGAAFVISSNSTQSLLLTSYSTIAAVTHAPAPVVYVRQGSGADTPVTVSSWDPTYDLALLTLPQGNLPALTAAPTSPAPRPGDRLFAAAGLSTAGASIESGTVVDVSSSGLATDAAIGPAFQGGPIVNQSGQVVAVGSRSYNPMGFTSNGIWYAPYVEAACNKVLTCPNGTLVGAH